MGMFDDLTCKYPLPRDKIPEGRNWDLTTTMFQTKSMDCVMSRYEIREDGTLWYQAYDIEDQSERGKWKRDHPGEPIPKELDNFEAMIGSAAHVNKRWLQEARFIGEIRFYSPMPMGEGKPDHWLEFSAYFVNGKLVHVHPIN